ncbi:MAG: hypothetical protein ACREFH_00425 [Stellaceae bacterium]
MALIPTAEEEDAKRPNREREGPCSGQSLPLAGTGGQAWLVSGIRGFKPTLRRAPERLARLLTPEGMTLPPNTLAELGRDMARLRFVVGQIREIEEARLKRLEQHPELGSHAMVRRLAQVIGVGVATADLLVHEILSRTLCDRRAVARYVGLTGAPDESGARRREKGQALARTGGRLWTPAFHGGDEQKIGGAICLVCTTSGPLSPVAAKAAAG